VASDFRGENVDLRNLAIGTPEAEDTDPLTELGQYERWAHFDVDVDGRQRQWE
jgi:hypothetical protein